MTKVEFSIDKTHLTPIGQTLSLVSLVIIAGIISPIGK